MSSKSRKHKYIAIMDIHSDTYLYVKHIQNDIINAFDDKPINEHNYIICYNMTTKLVCPGIYQANFDIASNHNLMQVIGISLHNLLKNAFENNYIKLILLKTNKNTSPIYCGGYCFIINAGKIYPKYNEGKFKFKYKKD